MRARWWDPTLGLEAHERLTTLPSVRIDTGGPRIRRIRPNAVTENKGRLKPHCCKDCGDTRPEMFYDQRKSNCKACMQKNRRNRVS